MQAPHWRTAALTAMAQLMHRGQGCANSATQASQTGLLGQHRQTAH